MQAYTPPVDQPPPQAPASQYGGFWLRFAAHLADGVIVGFSTMLALIALIVAADLGPGVFDVAALAIIVVGQIYHAYFVSSKRMATPGKRLCALYVTDLEGRRLSFGRALWRNLASFFSYVTLYVGFIMAGVTGRKQALHDKLAGTLVHRQPGRSSTGAIVIIVVLCLLVPVTGIIAAVAIPAYHDFTVRSRMVLIQNVMSNLKGPIEKYALEKGAWPATWKDIGLENPAEYMQTREREILQSLSLGKEGEVIADVRVMSWEGELRLTPKRAGDRIEWDCSSSEKIRKYVAPSCRK